MHRIGTFLAVAAMTGLLGAGMASPAALAAGESTPNGTVQSDVAAPSQNQLAPDGYLYAWMDRNFSGEYCRWLRNDTDWGSCGPAGSMLDEATSVWNNGYPGGYDDVYVYYDTSYNGAYKCLGNGGAWGDLSLGRERFDRGRGKPGYGEWINNNAASHKWVTTC